jgi:hypothetical protein
LGIKNSQPGKSAKMFSLVALYLKVVSGRLSFDADGRPIF